MKHPFYPLRPNKAVDRLAFMEAIRHLDKIGDLSDYTYYGMGGPHLEEFRLLYEFCPQIGMVSIEKDEEIYKRQRFHLPCGTLRLECAEFSDFLASYDPNDGKSVFWLDYTGLFASHFSEFAALLGKLAEKSMVKVSLRAEPRDYFDRSGEEQGSGGKGFREEFGDVMPDASADPPIDPRDFACLIQDMLQVVAERALPSAVPLKFLPVSSFYYTDGTWMLTLTGVIWPRERQEEVEKAFGDWRFANLTWKRPKRINVPSLSTKERLCLQEHLPCRKNAGSVLCSALGYLIDDDKRRSEYMLKQYADFHRYYPYFMRATP